MVKCFRLGNHSLKQNLSQVVIQPGSTTDYILEHVKPTVKRKQRFINGPY